MDIFSNHSSKSKYQISMTPLSRYRIRLNAAPLLNRTPPKVLMSPLGLKSSKSFEITVVHVCI